MSIAIAIDGPAGAGKSTIAKAAAKHLGFIYVDTGAMYRAIGLYCLRNDVDPADSEAVTALLENIDVSLARDENKNQLVILNGEDVSGLIRTEAVSMAASRCSAIPAVRAFLLDLQRNMAKEFDVIMDGRDIGTVVLPDAKVKIFLTASSEIRARRRYDELIEKGQQAVYEDVLADVIERDNNDMNRPIAPLKPAEDSVLVDTSELNLEESIALLIKTIEENK
ncbi:MAG: (d)CMP kinase [Ruminococcaceae bacterium]|nr:(d)CMP kinase [Oscillospiraceae bacterium]